MRSKFKFGLRCIAYVALVPVHVMMLPAYVIAVFMWAFDEDLNVSLVQYLKRMFS